MEESPYVPNCIPPALVVFSQQQQSCFTDAGRMQRPFGSQITEGKEVNLPNLCASSFGLRPIESYGGLPNPLVHLQNPFLHPALEARFQFGSSGAFRPVTSVASSSSSSSSSHSSSNNLEDAQQRLSSVKSLPSAFSAPTSSSSRQRKLQLESNASSSSSSSAISDSYDQQGQTSKGGANNSSNNNNGYNTNGTIGSNNGPINLIDRHSTTSSCSTSTYLNGSGNGSAHSKLSRQRSPSPMSLSSPKDKDDKDREHIDADETSERNMPSPNSDYTDRSSPEDSMISNKRKRKIGEIVCPACEGSVRAVDLESHLLSEVEQLMCMTRMCRPPSSREEVMVPKSSSISSMMDSSCSKREIHMDMTHGSRWESYNRVRANRQSRLRLKTKRRREESGDTSGPQTSCPICHVQLHGSNEQISSHVENCLRKNGDMTEDDETVDIEGNGDGGELEDYEWNSHSSRRSNSESAINMSTRGRKNEEENDCLEVVVDGDDTSLYGQSQYSESDIQASIMGSSSSSCDQNQNQEGGEDHDESRIAEEDGTSDDEVLEDKAVNNGMIIKALKKRIRELVRELRNDHSNHSLNHCLICKAHFRKPVVSIACWHVYCEECWLRTLAVKKLCPQCSMITSAADLRRVYL